MLGGGRMPRGGRIPGGGRVPRSPVGGTDSPGAFPGGNLGIPRPLPVGGGMDRFGLNDGAEAP